ncbi:putative ABC transporter ATP-binding protein YxlF [Paraliobacillus quinghaiensis]|uniref:ABC transporter ATP-binding protein YxlF n=1 Tax=Paraliobacillus quinghaiensis TaxID=470815 RepID=A0A917TN75_9BACI|nr:ABC transporter ATP-binding protein [Paraliobacillus quinghaiensis]GGM29986.1 putative ABC transporter ATP-binding protein YxlF [Paraliobacillus quinghaiensis]
MFNIHNLTKKFDGTAVVKDVSFSLSPGNCVALLGANGAGKTTTLRMLSGLLKPTSGKIEFEGMRPGADIREHIGYLPQYPIFHNWMTGKEFLVYVGQLANLTKANAKEQADYYLERVGILEAKNQRIGKYSGGMKQRLGIAQAMIHRPQMIMLDEPVSSLDPIGRREVLTLMEELKQQTTILFSTHILSDAEEISDSLLLMHQGEIVESGSLVELRDKHQSAKINIAFKGLNEEFIPNLEAISDVSDVIIDKNELICIVKDLEKARQSILAQANTENWPLTKFEVSQTSLEELFMKVVQN